MFALIVLVERWKGGALASNDPPSSASSTLLSPLQYITCMSVTVCIGPHTGRTFDLILFLSKTLTVISKVVLLRSIQCHFIVVDPSFKISVESCKLLISFQLCMAIFQDAPNIIVYGSIVVWYLCQVVAGLMKSCQRENRRRHGFMNFATTNRYAAKNVIFQK